MTTPIYLITAGNTNQPPVDKTQKEIEVIKKIAKLDDTSHNTNSQETPIARDDFHSVSKVQNNYIKRIPLENWK